jgi:signal transduction histidine kinase
MIDITQSKNTAAELQKHHQEIQSLQEISQIVLEATEPNAGIQKALERCVTVGGFDFGDILLTTPEGEFVSVVAAYGFSDPANLQRTRRRRSSTHRRERLQQSSILHNMQAADRFRSLKPEGAETAVIVPLRAGDHSLGLLQLVSRRAKEVRPNELALAEAMGRQIGIAIQKAKLTDDLQTNLRRVNTLYECNVALNSTLDVRAVLEILLDKMDFFPSRNAVIAIQLIDSETGRLEYFANRNLDEQAWIREFGGDRNISAAGLTKYTIESGVPVVIQDLCSDRRVRHPEFFRSQGLFSYLGVPVRIQERPVGIVAIYSRAPYEFSAEEISSVASLASQAAIAIHNARLYAEVEKQSRELAALFDVTAAATQSLEMDRVLDQVIHRINEIFLFDATRFYLFDDRAEWLHCRATHQVTPDFLTRTVSFKKGQGITGRVGATGTAIIFNDTRANPQYQQLSLSKKAGQRFLAGFPVKYESETLGVIMCIGQQPRQLTSHEIDLITSLSSQIAVAVANARLYEQTKDQAEQLRNLAMRIESVREQERHIISREIHDELGQTLTALKFDASWIRGRLSNLQSALADRLAEMSAMIDNTIQAIREIAARLRPDILDKLGLAAAMEWQLQDFRKRTGIQYHLTADPLSIHLDEQQATTLFRILQESLANVARHSHATRVHIDLEQPAGEVFLRVEDDGDGIDNEKIFDTQSLGLLGMRERAVALGGNVTVERNLNRGTTLTAHLPIDRSIQAETFLSRSEPT